MKRWQGLGVLISAGLFGLVVSCQSNEPVEPTTPTEPQPPQYQTTPYPWQKPANFPDPVYDFSKNPLTQEGVRLGRALFFDGMLSHDGTITCGFCHIPEAAFAHTDHTLSHGIRDQIGPRNGLNIQNVAWSRTFFWDGGIRDLDLLPIAPIQNPVEMGDTLTKVLDKVRNSAKYPPLFYAAFGTRDITQERFLKALSQFMLTMVSANSRYDKYVRKEAGGTLNEQELRGLNLFKQNCSTCHTGELFTDQSFRNNGLLPNPNAPQPDLGRYSITLNESDRNKFRVPSLRNIERTLPYMHDGRFSSLEAVLNHYASGVKDNAALDPVLKQNGQVGIALTKQDQQDIIAFLRTLTDQQFVTDRQFKPER
ncbi:cytochrome-c peroxidase [Fibrisoma montanum]|uniref:Cytochrome-c peroxidase n=1 Tax=Fibrisoma montanum TaxID=2305895 RepID=A0A418MDU2_9BACT|nr:cytochrome c peroxidase [Fibrisoma montanum]RIV24968.1 cytochrome-c peroxidase [Fibrisoma montanum]